MKVKGVIQEIIDGNKASLVLDNGRGTLYLSINDLPPNIKEKDVIEVDLDLSNIINGNGTNES